MLAPALHGRGFAREAMAAVLDWADANLPGRRIMCMIEPDNIASIRLAETLGFVEIERAEYKGGATVLFERER